MKLGGPIMEPFATPQEWAACAKKWGYDAVYFPLDYRADTAERNAYAAEAARRGLCIAEVGAWSNPLSSDSKTAAEAILFCQNQLALADDVGAKCCVNIAGSLGDTWDGPHIGSFTPDTFARVVDSVRSIIDAVKPTRTYYTLELMPWMIPDSADAYLDLIRAIDRPRFAVHLDPVNIICSPRAYYQNGAVIKELFQKLGPYIKSCHAKDIWLENRLTVHLNERPVGEGGLDYQTYLQCLRTLPGDTPLMLEHLDTQEDLRTALQNLRRLMAE